MLARVEDGRVILDLRTVLEDPLSGFRGHRGGFGSGSRAVTVVVGTAGHIDHGKTTLLRALTGIDADRLPEERRRGMTIDVGYAHLTLPDGTELDFVDVPGHDRLVGNMLVGAGEIDAALLVVAADDGLRAQTHEHLDLLDALDVRHALVAITKADLVAVERTGEVCEDVAARLASTALAGAPIVVVSGTTGEGIEELRAGLVALRDRVQADPGWVAMSARPVRLAIDRAFRIKGRGTVVTGTLRGGALARGANLRMCRATRPCGFARCRSTAPPWRRWRAAAAPRSTSRATR